MSVEKNLAKAIDFSSLLLFFVFFFLLFSQHVMFSWKSSFSFCFDLFFFFSEVMSRFERAYDYS